MKSLLVLISGALEGDSFKQEAAAHTHDNLDSLAAAGCGTHLACRVYKGEGQGSRSLFQLSQLLSSYEDLHSDQPKGFKDRFKGMTCGVTSNAVAQIGELEKVGIPVTALVEPFEESFSYDVNVVHVQVGVDGMTLESALSTVDGVVAAAFSNDEILVHVFAGHTEESATQQYVSTLEGVEKTLVPLQSFQLKDGKHNEDVSIESPLMGVQHLSQLTRKDATTKFVDCSSKAKICNGLIFVDRLIYEIGFLLDKLPKYGA
eukprot:GFYU01031548.1.p1 GENE.GFYU01031548.1~~GFYU01031548.1.p1  ORF type:complete len:260 (-),score=75.49 GFYU01031548.1:243-1022(-)